MSTVQENASKPVRSAPDPVIPMGDVIVSIQVPISASDYTWLEKNSGGKAPAEKLASYTKWFVARQAGGGLMIEPNDMDHLARMNEGVRFETSKDVVRAVEKALKREDGQYSFHIAVDPEYHEALVQQAEFNGTTPEKFLEHVGNGVLSNGWYAEFTPTNGCLTPISESDLLTARRVLGKFHFTGRDIAEALGRLEKLEGGKTQEKAA